MDQSFLHGPRRCWRRIVGIPVMVVTLSGSMAGRKFSQWKMFKQAKAIEWGCWAPFSPKWPTKCNFMFNHLEKRTRLNTIIFYPYEMPGWFFEKTFIEAHTFLTKCLCCFSKPRFGPYSFNTKCQFDFDKSFWNSLCFLTLLRCSWWLTWISVVLLSLTMDWKPL